MIAVSKLPFSFINFLSFCLKFLAYQGKRPKCCSRVPTHHHFRCRLVVVLIGVGLLYLIGFHCHKQAACQCNPFECHFCKRKKSYSKVTYIIQESNFNKSEYISTLFQCNNQDLAQVILKFNILNTILLTTKQ